MSSETPIMSLRAKLIVLFCVLAVGPLAAMGVFDYVHSMGALRALIASQTRTIAERAAAELGDRYALRQSDLLLLGENAETQRLYAARANGDSVQRNAARAAAAPYLRQAWQLFSRSYYWVEFRDPTGAQVYRLGEERGGTVGGPQPSGEVESALLMEMPIRGPTAGRPMGAVVAAVRPDALLPRDALEARFGRSGYTMVLDRGSGKVVFHPRHAFVRRTLASLMGPAGWNVDTAMLSRERGSFVYEEADTTRVAAFATLAAPAWTVLASGAVDEFAPSFLHQRLTNLLLVLLVTALIATAFVLLTRRATRSLEALTAAADEVGSGNFAPTLPGPGKDEVGRLAAAFGLMVAKVRDMLREIETSRHMAAVGQFAARLSHEIRNPLTSLKLNLQSVARDAERGALPPTTTRPIEICLREIERLDRVVRGALSLGRDRGETRVRCGIHQVVTEALDVVHAQLEQHRVAVTTAFKSPTDTVTGDPEHLKAAFLNLFLNAAEAMPDGGSLTVTTEQLGFTPAASLIRVTVADSGPGIPAPAREKIFQPFYSTKPGGTGFGLPLALRTVEEHGGRLAVASDGGEQAGATFVVELPLAGVGAA